MLPSIIAAASFGCQFWQCLPFWLRSRSLQHHQERQKGVPVWLQNALFDFCEPPQLYCILAARLSPSPIDSKSSALIHLLHLQISLGLHFFSQTAEVKTLIVQTSFRVLHAFSLQYCLSGLPTNLTCVTSYVLYLVP